MKRLPFIPILLTLQILAIICFSSSKAQAESCPSNFPSAAIFDPAGDQSIAQNDITSVELKQLTNDAVQVKVTVRGDPTALRTKHYLIFIDADNNPNTGRYAAQWGIGDDLDIRIGYDDQAGKFFAAAESPTQGTLADLPVLLKDHSAYVVFSLVPYKNLYQWSATPKFSVDVVNGGDNGDFVPEVGVLALQANMNPLPYTLTSANTIFQNSPHAIYLDYNQRNLPVKVQANSPSGPLADVYLYSSNPKIAQVVDGNGLITNFNISAERNNSDISRVSAYLPVCDLVLEDSLLVVSGNRLFKSGKAAFVMPSPMLDRNTGQAIDIDTILTSYDVAAVTSYAVDIQTALMGTSPPDGNNRLFAYNDPACGWSGQPIWLGWGCVQQPYTNGALRPGWGIYYHELGHTMLTHVFSHKFAGLYPANFGAYGEGWATLNGMYTIHKLIADKQKYGLSQKQVDSLQYEMDQLHNYRHSRDCASTSGTTCSTSLWAYENLPQFNRDFSKLDANIMDGMFLYIAETSAVNARGWEVFPRFYRLFLPQYHSQYADTPTMPTGNAFFIAAISAAAGQDLRPLFRDQWHFPIDEAYFNQTYPVLTNILASTTPPATPPSGLKAVCNSPAPGQVTLSWDTPAEAVSFALRANDTADEWTCSSAQPNDVCTDLISSPAYTFTYVSGHKYSWWVHAYNGYQLGDPAGSEFTCANNATFNDSQVVSISALPASVTAGVPFQVTVVMRNTGTRPWVKTADPETSYSIIDYAWASGNSAQVFWQIGGTSLPFSPVQPGEEATFTLTVRPPSAPGTYPFALQMIQSGIEFFGNITSSVNIAVQPTTNHPPATSNQNLSLPQNTFLAVQLTASDADGNPLTYAVVNAPAHGTLSGTAPNLLYNPQPAYVGNDAFTFKANDGMADSNIGTISITVTAVVPPVTNQAPVAASQNLSTSLNTLLTLRLTASDSNGDSLNYAVVTAPTHGTLTGTVPNLVYHPSTGYTGSDAINFKANDGSLDSNTATISITVTAGPVISVPDPDLSGINGRTYTINDTLDLTYNQPATSFIWEFDAVSASGMSGLRSPRAGALARVATGVPRLGLAGLHLAPGRYQVRVQAVNGSQTSSWAGATITLVNANLASVRVFPNPFRSSRGDTQITFDQMAANSNVKIFTVSAHWVRTLSAPAGIATWDLNNDSGDRVASGIYLYLIEDAQGNKSRGKLTLIR